MSTSPETIHKTPSNNSGMRAENTADDSDQIIIHLRRAPDETIFGAAIDGERIGFNKTELCWLGSLMLLGENGASMEDITGGEQPSVMRLIEIQTAWKSLSSKLEEASAGTVIVESLVIDDVMRYRIPNVLYQYQSELPVKANPPLKQHVALPGGSKQDSVIDDEDRPTNPTAKRRKGKKMGPIDRSEFTIINLDDQDLKRQTEGRQGVAGAISESFNFPSKLERTGIKFAESITPENASEALQDLIYFIATGRRKPNFFIINTPTEDIEEFLHLVTSAKGARKSNAIKTRIDHLINSLIVREKTHSPEYVPSTVSTGHSQAPQALSARNLPWADEAKCLQAEPDTFFPDKGGSTRPAKQICKMCTVQSECLELALVNEERFGIWGDMSERERRKLKRLAS